MKMRQTLLNRLIRTAGRLKGVELGILVGFFIAVGGIWAFVEIADEVLEGEAKDFDRWAFLLLRGGEGEPPLWMTEFAYNITTLGSVVVLTLTMLLVAGFLVLRGQFRLMAFILAAGVLGQSLVYILKLAFGRPRPDLFLHPLIAETSAGFPSGHAMMSAVVYLSIGALVARISPDLKIRVYILAVAFLLTFLVGLSRIYLGVHYPTDVLAGWSVGVAWACLCWLADRLWDVRGSQKGRKSTGTS
jgi:undecaprenyl-diphosphatase